MKTLCMETSYKFLIVSLLEDEKVIAFHQEESWKRQSELIMPLLDELFKNYKWQPQEVDRIVICRGPGSYTGVRIALTIAKVMAAQLNIPLYTVSTLQYYAGRAHAYTIMDARGGRVYFAEYNNGKAIQKDQIISLEDFNKLYDESVLLIGEGSVVGKEDYYPDLKNHFPELHKQWQLVENVDFLAPEYLKSKDSYKV